MIKKNFRVIKGGGNANLKGSGNRFFSAYVTDTRLMGVLALYIHWKTSELDGISDFHQFFYYDAEEYGLETYKSMQGDDEVALTIIEQGLIGGLGGKKVSVTEKEARFLVHSFIEASRRLHSPLPEPKNEFEFIIKEPVSLTQNEEQVLINKMCTPILSDHHLIHYFLMRCIARDRDGASYLSTDNLNIESIAEEKPATLCRNSIEEYQDKNGKLSYLCESLIESDGKYTIIVSEVTVDEGRVESAQRRSSFRITAAEAAMLLNRPEYVTVYEILTDPDDFDDRFLPMTGGAMQTAHDNGRLFLEFNKNNDHVNQRVFRLNEDIHGLYYVSDFGQLILAAYSLEAIQSMEKSLQKSSLGPTIIAAAKYEFKEPVLYEFIQSDFDDFTEFLESLKY